MAHFYGTVQGNRGEVSRCGSKSSGLTAEAFGWNIGGTVEVTYSDHLQTDVVSFYHNKGSNAYRGETLVAKFIIEDGEFKCVNTNYPELFI